MLHTKNDIKLTKTEHQIISLLKNETISQNNEYYIGKTTDEIAEILDINRSNTSRLLNKLNRTGIIGKKLGRPVLFYSKEAIKEEYKMDFFPTIIENDQEIKDLLTQNKKVKTSKEDLLNINKRLNDELVGLSKLILNSLSYPPNGLDILIDGEYGSGKSQFINHVISEAKQLSIIDTRSMTIILNCEDIKEKDIKDIITRSVVDDTVETIFIVNNFELLNSSNQTTLLNYLTNKRNIATNNPLINFILVTRDKENEVYRKVSNIIPTVITYPNFDSRSPEEKLLYLIYFFQREANYLDKSIVLEYNVINCFLLSKFSENLHHLKKEIKHSLLECKVRDDTTPFLKINFDDLSDSLLFNMESNPQLEGEIRTLYNHLKIRDTVINPNTTNEIIDLFFSNSYYIDTDHYNSSNLDHNEIIYKCKVAITSKTNSDSIIELDSSKSNLKLFIENRIDIPSIFKNHHHFDVLLKELTNDLINDDNNELSDSAVYLENETLVNQLIKAIENYYSLNFSEYTKYYIKLFVLVSNSLESGDKLPVVIISRNSKVSDSYSRIIQQFNQHIQTSSYEFNIAKQINNSADCNSLIDYCFNTQNNRGILILFKDELPSSLADEILNKIPRSIILNDFTINQIDTLLSPFNNDSLFIEDLHAHSETNETHQSRTEDDNLIIIIQENILNELLTFVNPFKVASACKNILDNLVTNLGIQNNERLTIQFITHVSFMIERLRTGVTLKHDNLNKYISENFRLFSQAEEELHPLERQFDITIPQSEIAYIVEIIKGD